MSLPAGWTRLAFDPARGIPQSAALAGSLPGLRAVVVGALTDVARALSAPADQVVHDTGAALLEPGRSADGRSAFTEPPPDSLATAAVPVQLVVTAAGAVLSVWPVLPGRALPVRGQGRLLGRLWIDEVVLAVGALVGAGENGSRISVGWRPLADEDGRGNPAAPAAVQRATSRAQTEEDPYDGLV